jgi:hypothetical protein
MGLFGIGKKKPEKEFQELVKEWCNNCDHDDCHECNIYQLQVSMGLIKEHHARTTNNAYAELVEFDRGKLGYPVHKRLKLYVEAKGTYHLDYYIAKLSHEVFKTHGGRGHIGREKIRKGLKDYAYQILRERRN